jgi:hypothetical protein
MKKGKTVHNGSVYASPPNSGSDYALGAVLSHHMFAVARNTSHSLYRNRKNIVNSRNVI